MGAYSGLQGASSPRPPEEIPPPPNTHTPSARLSQAERRRHNKEHPAFDREGEDRAEVWHLPVVGYIYQVLNTKGSNRGGQNNRKKRASVVGRRNLHSFYAWYYYRRRTHAGLVFYRYGLITRQTDVREEGRCTLKLETTAYGEKRLFPREGSRPPATA